MNNEIPCLYNIETGILVCHIQPVDSASYGILQDAKAKGAFKAVIPRGMYPEIAYPSLTGCAVFRLKWGAYEADVVMSSLVDISLNDMDADFVAFSFLLRARGDASLHGL